jgi:aspartate beta-hydroxylase
MLTLGALEVDRIVQALRAEFAGRLSARIVRMLEGCADPSCVELPARQRASQLWLPGVRAQAWHDAGEFEWAQGLEAAYADVAQECRAVSRSMEKLEYYLGDEHKSCAAAAPDGLLPPALGWKAFFLRRNGFWRKAACDLCPRTTALVRGLPLSAGDVMFSVLRPRSEIVPHYGLYNFDLTCHLGIDVPRDCALDVDGEARTWGEGRALVFDDTFRHAAYNRSDAPRSVLLFDFWSPEVPLFERPQLRRAIRLTQALGAQTKTAA